MADSVNSDFFDVIIVGAGLSGIGTAFHLNTHCPELTYTILESRDAIGGTWDLFRYPGVRSDSDMHTLGYAFKPWKQEKAIADGPSILNYIRETAQENGIDHDIRFRHKVVSASWDSASGQWTVRTASPGRSRPDVLKCRFLMMCSGYYRYEAGHTPALEGLDTFGGEVIHPQHWPENTDVSGKRVVVIGSGATAVTLVPELAKTAGHVVMLQRSPTYIVSRPSEDALANRFRKFLPSKLAYGMTRLKNVFLQQFFYRLARRKPDQVAKRLVGMVEKQLGPEFDTAKHFTPRYKPWDQRLCLVPDGDLFEALKDGTASVETDHIERLDETGILLKSGQHLPADIIVTATGLELNVLGDVAIDVDGARVEPNTLLNYKGIMFSGVPNFASIFGYTNASWTLKADISAEYICRLIGYMKKKRYSAATPINNDGNIETSDWIDFSSGYFRRAMNRLPRQAKYGLWRLNQSYYKDLMTLRFGKLDDGILVFTAEGEAVPGSAPLKHVQTP